MLIMFAAGLVLLTNISNIQVAYDAYLCRLADV